LVDYTGGTEAGALRAEAGLKQLGTQAGIEFRFDQKTNWQPVDSQRLLLWAGRFAKQEEFMTALNYRHFELAQSASERQTLLDAAADVGLDVAAATVFLDSDELSDDVWKSYGETIHT
jgi:predicted DsbA family dithiol-disulfide isomerase